MAFCSLHSQILYSCVLVLFVLQQRAPQILSHLNHHFWPVLIPKPGASSVPKLTIQTRSLHVQLAWAAWQGYHQRTPFQITGNRYVIQHMLFILALPSLKVCVCVISFNRWNTWLHWFAETKSRPGLKNKPVSLWSATSTLKMWTGATLH